MALGSSLCLPESLPESGQCLEFQGGERVGPGPDSEGQRDSRPGADRWEGSGTSVCPGLPSRWGSAGGGSALSLVLKGACGSVSVSPAFPEPLRMCPGVASRCLCPAAKP